jgi:hypothetical protein
VLPLAHHNLVMALPAFGPVLIVSLAVLLHALRNRPGDDA